MAKILIGLNLEFSRHSDMGFKAAVEKAASLGYKYIEPMVHWGRELMSEAGYFHTVSLWEDPLDVKAICDQYGVRCSGLSAHGPLGQPDITVNYIRHAVRFAAEMGAPVVNTDEGVKADFTDADTEHVLFKYTLTKVARAAEKRGIKIGLEQHQIYTRTPDGLDRIYHLVKSPAIGINFDTGNAYLAGQEVYGWLERTRDRLVHVHAKDISVEHSDRERGKVTGTPVGCACGDGVIDWARCIDILKPIQREICFSVECGTPEQAAASLDHLRSLTG